MDADIHASKKIYDRNALDTPQILHRLNALRQASAKSRICTCIANGCCEFPKVGSIQVDFLLDVVDVDIGYAESGSSPTIRESCMEILCCFFLEIFTQSRPVSTGRNRIESTWDGLIDTGQGSLLRGRQNPRWGVLDVGLVPTCQHTQLLSLG